MSNNVLRLLRRTALETNASEDWARYAAALERLVGVSDSSKPLVLSAHVIWVYDARSLDVSSILGVAFTESQIEWIIRDFFSNSIGDEEELPYQQLVEEFNEGNDVAELLITQRNIVLD